MPKKPHDNRKYDSKFESLVAETYPQMTRIPSRTKPAKLTYTVTHHYNPDFIVEHEGRELLIEAKGKLWKEDVAKFNHIPLSERGNLLFVLQNPFLRYNPRSSTSIFEWLERKGYAWCTVDNLASRIHEWKTGGTL